MSGVVNQNRSQQVHHSHQWRTHTCTRINNNKSTCTMIKQMITQNSRPPTRICFEGVSVGIKKGYIKNTLFLEFWTAAVCAMLLVMYSGVGAVAGATVGVGSSGGGGNGGVASRGSICDMAGCNCSAKAVAWTVVNCTLLEYQDMQVLPRTIPDDLIELQINAVGTGSTVTVHGDAFLGLRGFNRLLIDGVHTLRMRTHAVHNLTTASVLIQVRRCEAVWLERGSIKNSETSVIIEISKSEVVTVEGSAFSRLQEARFTDITDLQLQEGAFTFEYMRTYGRHGPVTSVSFYNVAIPRLPRACFNSALAEIHIRDTRISDVEAEAFKAKEISSIFISNSSIGRLRSRAMIDDLHVFTFHMAKSHVHVVETGAIVAAFTNFKIEHSRLDILQHDAINTPVVAHVQFLDNEFRTLTAHSLTFNSWNRIRINHNIIKHLHSNFLNIAETTTAEEFTFVSNEIYNLEENSLRFVADLEQLVTSANVMVFDNNFFNQTCHCDIGAWLGRMVNSTDVGFIVNSSFCTVDALLSNCFELPEGLINMRNFTELVCGPESYIKCEPYNGETKVLDTTAIMLLDDISQTNSSGFVLYLTLGCLFIVAIIATVIILLVRGAIWLDHKGYCDRFKLQYSTDQQTEDDNEDDIQGVVIVQQDAQTQQAETSSGSGNIDADFPEELTPELLQNLREKLEDPATHDEAREMIEKLYEMFIVDDSYTNNNRTVQQQEEAHLYEELGLNLHINQQRKEHDMNDFSNNLLKLMEDFLPDEKADNKLLISLPKLVNEYSEPSDAEFHVYSELKHQSTTDTSNTSNNSGNDIGATNSDRKDSLKSTASSGASGSGKMAFRPLPAKPSEQQQTGSGEAKIVVDQQTPGTSTQQYKF